MNRTRSFILVFSVFLLLLAFGGHLAAQEEAKATFAGGCFWCMEPPYDELDGVISTVPGYSGGHVEDPTYREVVSGTTGHLEVMQVTYDPSVVTYEELLEVFWVNIDPVDGGGQFCDRGQQYTTAIFYHDEEQRQLAEESREEIAESNDFGMRRIQTDIRQLEEFYRAEEYHQDYYRKNPLRYSLYVRSCGRERRLEELWGS
ncbi:MAG: peptide-methionine (S)-S-oxide reductase MsrA [Spirochaetes bacterium]|jgi:peptide-methionine (S)-S-oxide reductase|nr:peptide-methionine (S)-S-oxide reductase MsrA [Spirochaetota bacterium]